MNLGNFMKQVGSATTTVVNKMESLVFGLNTSAGNFTSGLHFQTHLRGREHSGTGAGIL